jgi:hypothetical protein
MRFSKTQALPAGYEVGGEWGERRDGTIGVGCYYWTKPATMECGEPKATRWAARADAIAHAANGQ